MPRKTLKQRRQSTLRKTVTDTDKNRNRIREISNGLTGLEKADDLMLEILEAVKDSYTPVPESGKAYVFIYNAKTPNIRYDQNPLVLVGDVFLWGFRGYNFHWGETRQYTFQEVSGNMYEVTPSEVKDLQQIPFANIKLNN